MKQVLLFILFPFLLLGQSQIGADIDGEAADDFSGVSISLSSDGLVVAIGAAGNSGFSGHVRIYENLSNVWTQVGADIDGEAGGDQSGSSVSLSSDGSVVAIGAPLNAGTASNAGHVRVYDLSALLSSDEFILTQFILFPNPVKDQFTIKLQQGLELQKVNIYNNLGQLIKSTTKNIVRTTNFSQGIYFVEIETNQGKATKKMIVE